MESCTRSKVSYIAHETPQQSPGAAVKNTCTRGELSGSPGLEHEAHRPDVTLVWLAAGEMFKEQLTSVFLRLLAADWSVPPRAADTRLRDWLRGCQPPSSSRSYFLTEVYNKQPRNTMETIDEELETRGVSLFTSVSTQQSGRKEKLAS